MIAIAHFIAVTLYLGAAALAATPFARPVKAPVRATIGLLAAGVVTHAIGLAVLTRASGSLPLTGLGPALSVAAFILALTLLVVEQVAHEVSLTLVTAPLAAVAAATATIVGLQPGGFAAHAREAWLVAHVALSFGGFAAFATAAAAGTMYLVERRGLRSRRFDAIFRLFPPLATLDRMNHVASIAGWIVLTLGIALAVAYALSYHEMDLAKLLWGTGAWLAVSTLAIGRVLGGWQARRAAVFTTVSFSAVVLLYVAMRIVEPMPGRFL